MIRAMETAIQAHADGSSIACIMARKPTDMVTGGQRTSDTHRANRSSNEAGNAVGSSMKFSSYLDSIVVLPITTGKFLIPINHIGYSLAEKGAGYVKAR